MLQNLDPLMVGGHSLSVGALVAAAVGWIPTVGALVALIFYFIQIYESKTFQHWKNNFLFKRNAKKLARLRAKERTMQAEIAALEIIRQATALATNMVDKAKSDAASKVVAETNAIVGEKIQRDLDKASTL